MVMSGRFTCRRRSPGSTSASSRRRIMVTRNSAALRSLEPPICHPRSRRCRAAFVNQYVAGVRYQGTCGPVGVYGFGTYIGSGHINYTGTRPSDHGRRRSLSCSGQPVHRSIQRSECRLRRRGIDMGRIHLAGSWQGGQYNGMMALEPKGGTGANAWGASIFYSAGPFSIGTTYYSSNLQGAVGLTGLSQRHDRMPSAWAALIRWLRACWGSGNTSTVSAPGRLRPEQQQVLQPGWLCRNNDNHMQAALAGVRVRW